MPRGRPRKDAAAGAAAPGNEKGLSDRSLRPFYLVEPRGIEPRTSTMPSSPDGSKNKDIA
jgi:hypothetical protein